MKLIKKLNKLGEVNYRSLIVGTLIVCSFVGTFLIYYGNNNNQITHAGSYSFIGYGLDPLTSKVNKNITFFACRQQFTSGLFGNVTRITTLVDATPSYQLPGSNGRLITYSGENSSSGFTSAPAVNAYTWNNGAMTLNSQVSTIKYNTFSAALFLRSGSTKLIASKQAKQINNIWQWSPDEDSSVVSKMATCQ